MPRSNQNETDVPIKRRILRYALFATLTLLSTSAVNLTDAYFVSKLGSDATAAVGVAFAVQFLIQAVGYTLGMGGGSLLSRAMGAKEEENGRLLATLSLLMAIAVGAIISLTGITLIDRLLPLLGANESIYALAKEYLRLLLLSAPWICFSLVLSQLLRAAGNAAFSMVGFTAGGAINLILTPLFLFRFHMGIAGAGYAILIGYAASSLLLFLFTFSKKSRVKPTRKIQKKIGRKPVQILWTGLPSFCRHGFSGLATILLNNLGGSIGTTAIAAITVVSRISLLSLSFCTGIGQGMIPVAGYHYGAKDVESVRRAYRFSLLFSSILTLILSIPVFLYAPQLIGLFRHEEDIIRIGTTALRAQSAVYVLHGTITATTMLLQAVGRTVASTVLACARQGIFFLPLIFLIPQYFRFIQSIADILTFFLTLFFISSYRGLRPKKKKGPL